MSLESLAAVEMYINGLHGYNALKMDAVYSSETLVFS
jgi:hypothetical protein